MIQAVIFDFDGTLVDSEDNYYLADKILITTLHDRADFVTVDDNIIDETVQAFFAGECCDNDEIFTKKDKTQFIGLDGKQVITLIKNKYNLPGTVDQLLTEKNRIYIKIARNHTTGYPKMLQLVQKLHSAGVNLAVASGTYRDNLLSLLNVTGLQKYFKTIISGDDVQCGKPNPAMFLLAAKKLGCSAQDCFVIEDSLHGIEAAISAKMHLFAVPYLVKKVYDEPFYKADCLSIGGMETFDPDRAFEQIMRI